MPMKKRTQSISVENQPVDVIEWGARLVGKIGDKNFFLNLPELIQELWHLDFCMIFFYPSLNKPVALFDGLTPEGFGRGVENYVGETYVINPFYRAIEPGLGSGLHIMSDLALRIGPMNEDISPLKVRPDHNEELGFVTDGWPENAKEIMLAVSLPDGGTIEVSISQLKSKSESEIPSLGALERMTPIIIAGIQKHTEIYPIGAQRRSSQFGAASLSKDEQFRELTRREFEVVELILSGHSSPSIALHLDIALPTVKSHRRNIFRKLEISAQAELFALAAMFVAS